MKVGIVGFGRASIAYHVPSFFEIPNTTITAVCDTKTTSLKNARRILPRVKLHSNLAKFLEEDLDIVDISTPGLFHYGICCDVIEAGIKNVVVEKPVTLSVKETLDLKKRSERKGVKVCVMQNWRFKKCFSEVYNAYKDGKLGQITKVVVTFNGLDVRSEPWWYFSEAESGGILYELDIHLLDLETLLCGEAKNIEGIHLHPITFKKYVIALEAIVSHYSGATGIFVLSHDTTKHSSVFVNLDIYGTAQDAHVRFFPPYYIIGAGAIEPQTHFKREFSSIYDQIKWILTNKYRRETIYRSHYEILSRFVKSVENNLPVPVSLDDVIPTMKLADMLYQYVSGSENDRN